MRSKFTLLLALVFLAFAVTDCKKKTEDPVVEEPTPPAPSGISTVTELIAANGAIAQTVTVSATTASTININGVIFEIPANAFVVNSTSATATGVVNLTVKTITTKSEIIFSGAGANSTSSRLVTTKGCVKATASQNTQSLRLGSSGNFFVNVPDGASPPPQKKFYAPKVTATDSLVVWALDPNDVNDIPTQVISGTTHHRAALDSLKWLNVGTQFDSIAAPEVAMTASVNATMFNKNNTLVYVSFNGSLTVGAMFEISPGIFRISNMPQGKGVHVLAISVINGQYYMADIGTTISSTQVNLNLQPVSQTQMQNMVAALP